MAGPAIVLCYGASKRSILNVVRISYSPLNGVTRPVVPELLFESIQLSAANMSGPTAQTPVIERQATV